MFYVVKQGMLGNGCAIPAALSFTAKTETETSSDASEINLSYTHIKTYTVLQYSTITSNSTTVEVQVPLTVLQ